MRRFQDVNSVRQPVYLYLQRSSEEKNIMERSRKNQERNESCKAKNPQCVSILTSATQGSDRVHMTVDCPYELSIKAFISLSTFNPKRI